MLIAPNPDKGIRYAIRALNKTIESLKNAEGPYKYTEAALKLSALIYELNLLMGTHNLTLPKD